MEVIHNLHLNLNFFEEFEGSYAIVKKCEYDDKIYAYKKFTDQKYLSKNISKIENLSTIDYDWGILPKFLIYDDKSSKIDGYLSDFCEYEKSTLLKYIDNKVEMLLNIKENIKKMHNFGIIHGDLHFGNILIDPDNCNSKIIDFDNCEYKQYRIKRNYVSDYTMEYIKKYGVNKGLDIFLFNLITFSCLNQTSYFSTRFKINDKKYGVFDSEDAKKICDELLFVNDVFKEEYLIDVYTQYSKK